jgi:hypothetical protein
MARYNREAVQSAIEAHNRNPRGGPIGKREAFLIHALLKGHQQEDA